MKIEPDWLDISGVGDSEAARIIAEELAKELSCDPEFQAALKRIQEQIRTEILHTVSHR